MLQKGQVFNNRYKIISTLGEGGFGAVYKVWDDNLQRYCAIKENLQVSTEAQKQFKREAIMLANLNHPHLVRVTDYFFISDQGQYLVMDFVDGNDLQTILTDNGGPLPTEQALAWIRQVCDALIYIHNQNPPIIHRDIKPANIRVTPQGNAVLVDFGLAKTFDVGMKTSMGARGLTPHFAAPEQYGLGGTDAQSDIYSLGITLYCLLTYSVPPDSVEIMVGNANPPSPAKAISSNISDSVSDALQCAMQIRRTERYKSVSDFKNALLNAHGIQTIKNEALNEVICISRKDVPVDEALGKVVNLMFLGAITEIVTITLANLPELREKIASKFTLTWYKTPAQVATSTNKLTLSNGMEFMRVTAGKFIMGSNKRQEINFPEADEKPEHIVDIPYDYWIGRYLVTKKDYAPFKLAKWKDRPDKHYEADSYETNFSWSEALEYRNWLRYSLIGEIPSGLSLRIPTEAEWEKAARGTDGREYPWGNDFDISKCSSPWHLSRSRGSNSPQGDSPYGCADMVGKVWQWTCSLNEPYPFNVNTIFEKGIVQEYRDWLVVRGGDETKSGEQQKQVPTSCCRYLGCSDDSIGIRFVLAPPWKKDVDNFDYHDAYVYPD